MKDETPPTPDGRFLCISAIVAGAYDDSTAQVYRQVVTGDELIQVVAEAFADEHVTTDDFRRVIKDWVARASPGSYFFVSDSLTVVMVSAAPPAHLRHTIKLVVDESIPAKDGPIPGA